jgi:hypothetical protein
MNKQLINLKKKMKNGSLYANRFRKTIKEGCVFDIDGKNDEIYIMSSTDMLKVECLSLFNLQSEIIGMIDENEELNPNDVAFDASIDVRHLIPITGAYMETKLIQVVNILNLN